MHICKILVELCNTAFTLNYDIDSDAVFNKLFWVASLMYSQKYMPMRVLGVTAEGVHKKGT